MYHGYYIVYIYVFFFFFKQKTAYEMRISDWSSDVCSSDLAPGGDGLTLLVQQPRQHFVMQHHLGVLGGHHRLEVKLEALIAQGLVEQSVPGMRSEERRVGKECVSTCRSRWSP